jgi:hypothetical protein
MIHNLWHSIANHDSQPLAQNNTPWFVVNHGLSCRASGCESWLIMLTSGCESWWVMLSQWFWIMLFYDEPVVVNHVVLCWASVCESWCVILSQWLWIMVCYIKPVVVNPSVSCWASGCESWCGILSQWLWIMWVSIPHHDIQRLAQNNSPWVTITCLTLHTMINNHWISITHHN